MNEYEATVVGQNNTAAVDNDYEVLVVGQQYNAAPTPAPTPSLETSQQPVYYIVTHEGAQQQPQNNIS